MTRPSTIRRGRRPAGALRRFCTAMATLVGVLVGVPALLVACSRVGLDASHPFPAIGSVEAIRSYVGRDLTPTEVAPIAMRVLLIVGWLLWLAMVLSVLAAVLDVRGSPLRSWFPRFVLFAAFSRWIAAGLTTMSTLAPGFVSAAPLASPRPFTVSSITPDQPAVAEAPVPAGFARVQRGESVEMFAERLLGDAARWPEIWELNKQRTVGPDGEVWAAPWRLVAGWDLRLPPDAAPAKPLVAPAAAERSPAGFAPRQSPWTRRENLDVVEEYEVTAGDSFWMIAERFLPDDSSERDVWDFTQALMEFNAPRLGYAHPAMLRPGDLIDIVAPAEQPDVAPPAEPPGTGGPDVHRVVAGDSYWEIAESTLGDDATAGEVLEKTAELIELNSSRLGYEDPRLIHPGDVVHLADRPPDGPAVSPVPGPDSDAIAIDILPSDETARPAAAPMPPPVPATTTTTSTTSTTTTTSTLPPPTVPPADVESEGGGQRSGPTSPIGLGQLALIATGVVALLAARRRARLRAAEPPARVPMPTPEMAATERMLRRIDDAERLLRIDIALRAAAAELVAGEQRVVAVRSAPDGTIEIHLDAPAALTEPWHGSGSRWRMSSEVPAEDLAGRARAVGAPCVALTQLGVDDGGWDVLVDLEATGLLCVEAEPAAADDVVRAIAVGLATSEFAEVAHLIGVGIDEDAFLGHRHAQSVATVDEAIELAATLVGATATVRQSTFTLRARHTGGEPWEPAVVVVAAAHAGELTTAVVESLRCRGGLAFVTAGRTDGAPWRLHPEGATWTLDPLGLRFRPAGIDAGTLDDICDVVGDPVISDPGHASHVLLMDAQPPDPDPDTVVVPVDGNGHNGRPLGNAATQPRSASPQADAGYTDPPWSLMVRLLGNVEVVDRTSSAARFERSKTLELVTWLVTHRARASRSAARTALWELDVRDATFANVVSEARRSMARHVPPPEGDEWLRRTMTDELSLHDEVVADADLVRARLERSRTLHGADAMSLLRPAVELVDELPFSGTSYLWPDPEGITSGLVVLATNVTAEYARLALAAGDADGVFWATSRGLRVLPGQEALIALRMRAHAEAGDLSGVRLEWETYEKVINADPWTDGEPAPKLVALRKELLSQ